MAKVNPNNGNETKSDIFPRDIFKFDTISFFIKNYQSISMTFKISYLNVTFFIACKILKYFNDFCNWQFSIL